MTLDDFIDAQVQKGVYEPKEIARLACARPQWLVKELNERLTGIVTELVRRRIGADRRAHVPGATRFQRAGGGPVLHTLTFVPGVGMMPTEEMTAEHCDLRAQAYRELADENVRQAEIYEQWAAELRLRGGGTVGDLFAAEVAA